MFQTRNFKSAPNKYIKSKHIVYVFYVYIILTHVDKLAFM